MSYEGYEEFLCENGHHWTEDAMTFIYGEREEKQKALICPCCQSPAKYSCSVDETNGMDPEYPETISGPKKNIGFDNIPQKDHLGNSYFSKEEKYEPILEHDRWRLIEK